MSSGLSIIYSHALPRIIIASFFASTFRLLSRAIEKSNFRIPPHRRAHDKDIEYRFYYALYRSKHPTLCAVAICRLIQNFLAAVVYGTVVYVLRQCGIGGVELMIATCALRQTW